MACKTLTPQSIVNGALAIIGRPPSLTSRLGDLYDILGTTVESYRNRLRIHDGNFLLKKKVVTLTADVTEISFSEPSWGRPVLCDIDPDSVPANVTLPKREVDIVNIQDLDQYRAGLPNIMGDAINAVQSQIWMIATAVAWNYETEDDARVVRLYFEFGGYVPKQAVTYRFFYEPGGVAEVMENEQADVLPEFVGLMQHDFALQIMPLAPDIDDKTYTRLEKNCQNYVERNTPVMDQFLQQGHLEQSGRYEGFNRTRYGQRLNRSW